jgi:hypothetical protein
MVDQWDLCFNTHHFLMASTSLSRTGFIRTILRYHMFWLCDLKTCILSIREWILLSFGLWHYIVQQVSTSIPLKLYSFFQNVHICLPKYTVTVMEIQSPGKLKQLTQNAVAISFWRRKDQQNSRWSVTTVRYTSHLRAPRNQSTNFHEKSSFIFKEFLNVTYIQGLTTMFYMQQMAN